MKNSNKKLTVLFCAVYFISYITRINYAATLTEIIRDMNITKAVGSIAVTGSFITYGFGQIISGFFGDRFKPQNVIFCGLVGASFINLSVAFLPNINMINAFWCMNGFFQALLWPPLVRICAENFKGNAFTAVIARITQASQAATIAVYAVVPLIITVSRWRTVFLVSGAAGAIFCLVWLFAAKGFAESSAQSAEEAPANQRLQVGMLIKGGIIPIFFAIILQGILRDGITTWAPTYVTEVFGLGTSVSILTSAVLPLLSIVSIGVVVRIAKKLNNELKTSFVFYFVAFAVSILLMLLFSKFVALDITVMAVIISCMHGVNNMLIGNVPYHFSRFGKVSTVSGLLNSATYIGSAISTYAFAALSDKMGWGFTISSWLVISAIGTLLCLSCIKKWKRFTTQKS